MLEIDTPFDFFTGIVHRALKHFELSNGQVLFLARLLCEVPNDLHKVTARLDVVAALGRGCFVDS